MGVVRSREFLREKTFINARNGPRSVEWDWTEEGGNEKVQGLLSRPQPTGNIHGTSTKTLLWRSKSLAKVARGMQKKAHTVGDTCFGYPIINRPKGISREINLSK